MALIVQHLFLFVAYCQLHPLCFALRLYFMFGFLRFTWSVLFMFCLKITSIFTSASIWKTDAWNLEEIFFILYCKASYRQFKSNTHELSQTHHHSKVWLPWTPPPPSLFFSLCPINPLLSGREEQFCLPAFQRQSWSHATLKSAFATHSLLFLSFYLPCALGIIDCFLFLSFSLNACYSLRG